MQNAERKATFVRNHQKSYPTAIKGEGLFVFDQQGKKYLDAVGCAKVVNIGHGVKDIGEAMQRQASQIAFVYGGHFLNVPQIKLSERVLSLAPKTMASVYFTSGGSEATEVAIKMARQYHLHKGDAGRYKIIGIWQSYHGATLGALSLSGQTLRRVDYDPYLLPMPHIPPPFCYRCPYGKRHESCKIECGQALENIIQREGPETVAAFIAEPVFGSSANGVSPPPEFFPMIREICNRFGVLMIVDEVITGFGRTGVPFGIMHSSVEPDLIICGKGISSGYVPLGAVILNAQIYDILSTPPPFFTGYTYSGHPVCCAGGLAVLDYMECHNLFFRAAEMGDYLQSRLKKLESMNIVGQVRGKGLLAGIEFVADKGTKAPFSRDKQVQEQIVSLSFHHGVIISTGSGGIVNGRCGDDIGIAPPFIIERKEIDLIVEVLADCIISVTKKLGM